MPRIKLIKVITHDKYDYYGEPDREYIQDEMSPWQDVTDEELAILTSMLGTQKLYKDNVKVVVWQDLTTSENIAGYINDIKKFIADEKKKHDDAEKKRQAKIEKSKQTREAKKLENAKKILAKNGIKVE